VSRKTERIKDDILVTSELVESHILTGSFPVQRDRVEEVNERGQVARVGISLHFYYFICTFPTLQRGGSSR
jgi:hypothetical protein